MQPIGHWDDVLLSRVVGCRVRRANYPAMIFFHILCVWHFRIIMGTAEADNITIIWCRCANDISTREWQFANYPQWTIFNAADLISNCRICTYTIYVGAFRLGFLIFTSKMKKEKKMWNQGCTSCPRKLNYNTSARWRILHVQSRSGVNVQLPCGAVHDQDRLDITRPCCRGSWHGRRRHSRFCRRLWCESCACAEANDATQDHRAQQQSHLEGQSASMAHLLYYFVVDVEHFAFESRMPPSAPPSSPRARRSVTRRPSWTCRSLISSCAFWTWSKFMSIETVTRARNFVSSCPCCVVIRFLKFNFFLNQKD